jgi:hypothetical protein
MTSTGRRTVIGLAVFALFLFAGRGAAEFLAEHWWGGSVSAGGAVFSTRWALFRLALDAGATLLAVAWFATNFLVAARLTARATAGSSAPTRGVPPLPPSQVRRWALPAAVLLGLLCGAGTAEWAASLALAWQAPRWGIIDQFHNLDIGFYIGILPALVHIHFLSLALALLGLVAVVILYAVGGSLRVASRRFVLDPGIRLHLGLLGATLAATLGAGYVLEPYEFASGLRPATGAAHVVLLSSMSWLLVGLAFAAGALTLYWGLRGRIVLPVGAWAAFGLFALVIRLLAPAAGSVGEGDREPAELRELEREAFGIPEVIESRPLGPANLPDSIALDGLWDPRALRPPGEGRWVAAARTSWSANGSSHPALLLVADAGERDVVSLVVVRDDLTGPEGHPLTVRDDQVAYPGIAPLVELPGSTARPGVTGVRVVAGEMGVQAGGLIRRLLLTWALQHNLLNAEPAARALWRLDPRERLSAIAPFVEWGTPRPVLDDGNLIWISDGYLYSSAFPGVAPVPWRGRPASYLRAAFLGVVNGRDGVVRVFERGSTDPLSLAWAAIARELVEPASAIPVSWAAAMEYPVEGFGTHAAVLRRRHWQLGGLVSPPAGVGFDTIPGPVHRAGFQSSEGRRLLAVLEGERIGAAEQLRVIRLDSLPAVESPVLLPARWERLPFVQQMRDSALATGWRYQGGPLQFTMTESGPLGWQAAFVVDSGGQGTLVALNLALAGRLGTGADRAGAWDNLRGERAAFPVSLGEQIRLHQAREWLLLADSAMRRGDLAGFGRAFEALRAILDRP